MFACLAANPGASAVHVSKNGNRSFSDRFARNLATTPELLLNAWALAAFSFDKEANTITAYPDGKATDCWIDEPGKTSVLPVPCQGLAASRTLTRLTKPNYFPKRVSTKLPT